MGGTNPNIFKNYHSKYENHDQIKIKNKLKKRKNKLTF